MRRMILLGSLVLVAATATAQEASPTPAPRRLLTDAEQERFLLEGDIVRRRSAPGGITNSQRATLRHEGFEHDVHIQKIDEYKFQNPLSGGLELDFRDSYRNNVAAYRLDRLLGLGMVPVTVVRNDGPGRAAFTWWVDDVLMDEKTRLARKIRTPDVVAWNNQMYVVRVFDQLIYNFDRNLGNLLIGNDWRIWMIDHTRAFKTFKEIKAAKDLGPRCERRLLAGMRRLEAATLKERMKDLLSPYQIDGLLARRDFIVRHYDEKIARQGEEAVLYDLPPRLNESVAAR
ncbi:MAG TPA: hypothetical protein VMR21_13580 [Vicinamibacteria bacterium]|nr:hypothetical protein [Vicinamibacteria bacterium]